jgi:hypothetical protein
VRQSRAGIPGFNNPKRATWAETTPDSEAVGILFATPIKAAPLARNIYQQKVAPLCNLGDGPGVSQFATACLAAKGQMPTNYAFSDLVLVMLHWANARTISISVTTQERVGRSMSIGATIKGKAAMNTGLNHGSARIYQFPTGGRAALGGRRYDETKTANDLASSRVSDVAVGGAWYHEAAIQEAKPECER